MIELHSVWATPLLVTHTKCTGGLQAGATMQSLVTLTAGKTEPGAAICGNGRWSHQSDGTQHQWHGVLCANRLLTRLDLDITHATPAQILLQSGNCVRNQTWSSREVLSSAASVVAIPETVSGLRTLAMKGAKSALGRESACSSGFR